jgi:hypothetical protein
MKEKTMGELAKENPDRSYRDLERYRDEDRAQEVGACIMAEARKDREEEGKEIDYHRYWKDMYEKEHKLRQEAQGEMTIVKGIGMNSPEMKKAQERIKELENNRPLDFPMDEMAYNEAKHRAEELDNSLAIALEINEEHQRYNGKLQTRLTELEEENKKLHDALNNKLESVRKAGL